MSEPRRYRDDEIRRIFELASEVGPPARPSRASADALTLDDLKVIGREVGIRPERIDEAARVVESRSAEPARPQRAGNPFEVRHAADLPRRPTSREWEILLTEIRETFDAPGRTAAGRETFEWRNGNLHVFVEPTVDGHRIRMRTRKGDAIGVAAAGAVAVGWSVVAAAGTAIFGGPVEGLIAPALVFLGGSATTAATLVRIRRWSRRRAGQMEYLAARARALLGSSPAADG